LEPVVTLASSETTAANPPNPNGAPLIPTHVVPWLVVLGVVASILAGAPAAGLTFIPPVVASVAGGVVSILAVLGIASPGLRQSPPK